MPLEIGGIIMGRKYKNRYYYDGDRLPISEELEKVPDPVYGKIINTSCLMVRIDPVKTSSVIGHLNGGDRVELLDTSLFYYKISFNGKVGYISSNYCKKEE